MKKLNYLSILVSFIVGISCNSQYQYKKEIQDGLFLTKVDGKYGLIGSNGEVLIPNEYDTLDFFGNVGYSVKNDKKGLIDREGKIIIPNEYEYLNFDGGSSGRSIKNGKVGEIDLMGNILIPNEYDNIDFDGNVGISLNNGKYGMIFRYPDGSKVVLSNEYDSIKSIKMDVFTYKDGIEEIISKEFLFGQ